MKKFFYLFFIVAAFLTLSISCSKAEQDTEIDNPSEEKTEPENATTIRFNVSLASEGGKATIKSDGKVTWNTGDQVTVYAVDDEGVKKGMRTVEVSINPDDNTKALIETVLPAGCTYYAAFPECESATFNGDVMTVSEPAAATAQTNSNNQVAVAKAEKIGGGSYSLQFKNVNHLLKFTVGKTLAGTVKSAELVSQTSGDAVSYDKVSYNFANGTSTKAGSKVTSLKRTVVEGDNFIALAPGFTMSGGFCLKLMDSTGKIVKLFFYDTDFTTEGNGGSNISNFETRLYTNLSKDETANCYLINSDDGSKFCFYAKTKGNGVGVDAMSAGYKNPDLSPTSVTYLWSTLNTATAPSSNSAIINNLNYHKVVGFATFDKVSTGNVIVAAKDSDNNIIWSWHLWLPEDKVENRVHQISSGVMNGYNMLNANLGALKIKYETNSTRDFGFFYQWGRKDPFVSAAQSDRSTTTITYAKVMGTAKEVVKHEGTTIDGINALAYAIQHPTTFIASYGSEDKYRDWYGHRSEQFKMWATHKTMYDPCPPGYKVPVVRAGPWGYFGDNTTWSATYGVRYFTNKDNKRVDHPAAGYLARTTGKYASESIFQKGYYWGTDDADANIAETSQGFKETNNYWLNASTCAIDKSAARAAGLSVRCCRSDEYQRH